MKSGQDSKPSDASWTKPKAITLPPARRIWAQWGCYARQLNSYLRGRRRVDSRSSKSLRASRLIEATPWLLAKHPDFHSCVRIPLIDVDRKVV